MMSIILALLAVFGTLWGINYGRAHASHVIDNPNPSPTADSYYHKVVVDDEVAYFTQEQVDTAIDRARRSS